MVLDWPSCWPDEVDLTFDKNRADACVIEMHLRSCDEQFVPPLSERVDLATYSSKLASHAVLSEAWAGDILIGLVAGYTNAADKRSSFVTNVSVMPQWHGQGIASRLVDRFVEHSRLSGFEMVELSVDVHNDRARSFYRKYGFVDDSCDGAVVKMIFNLGARQ